MTPPRPHTPGFVSRLIGRKSGQMRWSGFGGQNYGGASGQGNFQLGQLVKSLLPGSAYDYAAEAGDLYKNSAVAICLAWIRKNGPEPRLTVRTRSESEWEDDPDHEVLTWLEEPNPDYDDDTLQSATDMSLVVDGNAYWRRLDDATGRQRFWYIPHGQIEPRWPEGGNVFISHYQYTVDGKSEDIPVAEIVHFRTGTDPENDRKGWSELKTCLREVCSDNEASTYTAAILRNMGIPGVVISPENKDDEISPQQQKEMKGLWRRIFTREGRGEPMINNVRLNVERIGLSPEELALDKIRQLPEARICAAIGIPAQVVGLSVGQGQKTYRNQAEANRQAYENCLIPLQKTKAKQIHRALATPIRPGSKPVMKGRRVERLLWDYQEVQSLREDQSELSKRSAVEYQAGLVTKNEARAAIGKPPVPEGDTFCQAPTLRGAIPTPGHNSIEGEAA